MELVLLFNIIQIARSSTCVDHEKIKLKHDDKVTIAVGICLRSYCDKEMLEFEYVMEIYGIVTFKRSDVDVLCLLLQLRRQGKRQY